MISADHIKRRISAAAHDKGRWSSRLEDYYHYALPTPEQEESPDTVDERYDDTASQAVQDFSADLLNNFTPGHVNWLFLGPPPGLSLADERNVAEGFKQYAETVFSEIRRSNFAQAAQEAYAELSTGTTGLLITDIGADHPIHCESISLRELELARGAFGEADFRGRRIRVRAGDLEATWPEVEFPRNIRQQAEKTPDNRIEIVEGVHRDRTDRSDEVWTYFVSVDNEVIHRADLKGAGSCPFITPRWMTMPTTAWGVGPLYTALANIKSLNKLTELILRRLDKVVDPPTFYDDDGTINLEHGVEAGEWIPKQPGSEVFIWESRAGFDTGFFEQENLQMSIKRALFQDKPMQRGRTPPTATQWLEEASELARRMGAPAGRLVQELQFAVFQRFAYLLAERGVVEPVRLNGEIVRMEPISPLTRAQQQEEVVSFDRAMEILMSKLGPEQAAMVAKPLESARFIWDRMGLPMSLLRSEQEMQQLVEAAQQAAQQQGGGQ